MSINKLNILAYVDDIVLISPSASGLWTLIRVLGECNIQHNLVLTQPKQKWWFSGIKEHMLLIICRFISPVRSLGM